MNGRQRDALLALDERSDPPPAGAESWRTGERTTDAIRIALALEDAGHALKRGSRGFPGAMSAARTLIALKDRGLADNDGGGCFLPARWWVTPEGRAKVAELLA